MARTVLIVEPDALQRQLVDVLLAEDGHDFVFASTGREALETLKASTPDLALVTLELPDLTGAEICEKMKRITRLAEVPVVLVVGPGDGRGIDAHTRAIGRFVGADLMLQKPLGDKNLRDRVNDLLDAGGGTHRPRRPGGLTTEILEDTLADLKERARREALERENDRLHERIHALEEELASLRETPERRAPEPPPQEGAREPDEDTGRGAAARIAELERRNDLLRQELIRCKEDAKRGGWFGRGRG